MKRSKILITGASSGLGMGLAREFAARGATLALCARRTDRLDALAAELTSAHPGCRVFVRQLDVNDHAAVTEVFDAFATDLGGVDRVIVNAGIGKGKALGTGGFDENLATLETNLVAGLAQIEAAMTIFRAQQRGHLVVMSSMSAFRGMRRAMTTYAASKAGLAMLAEGLRAELSGRSPITVSTIYPGYIRTELNEQVTNAPFMVDADTGCRALAKAIEKEPATAVVPAWPWAPIGVAMRTLPLSLVRRLS
ncbi:SDR family oxidoreductase [Nocardia cyriacigeorgica]|uniref:SDR family oxidoreductase n=1 Tax=Nocardia cyriacigeorgica TaxID=135487 RepID=A0A5R8NPB1_9NOCA|nr:SDR family oxidoreductase [Nocardia cyriacigeorgica]TLF77453.1 SDR family oxidoreductase [Nocardia cyriacigeorgica]